MKQMGSLTFSTKHVVIMVQPDINIAGVIKWKSREALNKASNKI